VAKQAADLAPLVARLNQVRQQVHQVVVGQTEMVDRLLVGLLTGGHALLEGLPGLAKTLTVSTLAEALGLKFSRIQFTPDLLPSDVVGTLIYNPKDARFETRKGPVFANLVLADEINRSPAKVQAALLEAMQEKQVTLGDETFHLPKPFLVLATQNPVEQEGTYPLPEAQVDRFMMKVHVGYPTREQELEILRRMARVGERPHVQAAIRPEEVLALRQAVDGILLSERLERYIVDVVIATREPASVVPKLAPFIEYGASPRATLALALGAKAMALMAGRDHALPEDVKAIAPDVLNHRILLTFEAEAEGHTPRSLVAQLLASVTI
jgi:MoxR-like ATPase